MGKWKKRLILLVSFIYLFCNSANVLANTALFQAVKATQLSLGVIHKQYSILTESGWITANTIEADMTKPNLGFQILTSDNGVQNLVTTRALAAQNNAIAAINADFFTWAQGTGKGSPIGTVVKEGQLVTTPAAADNMVSFYQGFDGIFKAGHLGFHISLTAENGESLQAYGLNKYSDLSEPVIYDSGFGKVFVSNYSDIIKVVVVDDVIEQITDEMGEMEIPENGYILVCLADKTSFVADNLAVGEKLTRTMYLYPSLSNIKQAVGAGTMLIKDGEATPITHGDSGKNPRTAIGTDQTGKKLYLITVDGRQSSSIGMTLKELQNFMIQIGVYEGANLDGGGSTTLAARQLGEETVSVINSVSDSSVRAVTNAAAIVPTMPKGALYGLKLSADRQNVFVGTNASLFATGFDQYYNPVPVSVGNIRFSSASGQFENNTFRPEKAGQAVLKGELGGASGEMTLKVLDQPHSLAISPSVIDLTNSQSVKVSVTGKDKDGYAAPIDLSDLKVTIDKNIAEIDGNSIKKVGNQNGILKVELGQVSAHVLVKTSSTAKSPTLPTNTFIRDPQRVIGEEGFQFAVFGNMNKPKTLIETILTSRAIKDLEKADLVTFIGETDSETIAPLSGKTFSAKNYSITTRDNSAFILLNNRNSGLKDSVASQWPWFVEKCNTMEQKNLFVMLPNEVYGGFKDSRELEAFFSVLEGVVAKGKNVYLFANDWITNSQRINGIRYITTNGIIGNYKLESLRNQLAITQYVLVTITEHEVTYEFKSIY